MGAVLTAATYHLERVGGQEVQKPLPKRLHAIVQTRIIIELAKWTGDLRFEVLNELDVLVGEGDWLVPDVVVAGTDSSYKNGKLAQGAILAVEIMSPGQTIGQLFDKCEKLHAAGTRDCWILWPKKRAAWHYSAGELPIPVTDTFTAGTIRVDVAPLFANLPDDEESAS